MPSVRRRLILASMVRLSWFASLVMLGACAPSASSPDASSSGDGAIPIDAPAPLVLCGEPDRACPPTGLPYAGAPCEGDLACDFEGRYASRCIEGAWVIEAICSDDRCPPRISESCAAPFTGTVIGARVIVGPPDALRPYAEGEPIEVVWGAQGYPMIPYAVRIEDLESPPDCVSIEKEVRWIDGDGALSMGASLRMHCGMSRVAYAILPEPWPCAAGEHALDLSVRVAGVGESTAHLRVIGGTCP